jgi:N6-L-threonylcarbamoyladenine synthase
VLLLGIESSCDETAAAVLQDGSKLLSSVIDTQIDIHAKYGGVVPELASRRHLETVYPVVSQALTDAGIGLDDLDGLAVTQGPGLIGSLLIGLSFVKAISFVKKIPYVGVNHMEGHLLSPFLGKEKPSFPYVALVASGGHSSIFLVSSPLDYKMLGRTRDDAAGEAFDKVSKLLGLGYPGGPVISKLSEKGDRKAIQFPRAWLEPDTFDFSFSGVKTSVVNYVNQVRQKGLELPVEDICASFQEAIADVLVTKTIRAAQKFEIKNIVLAGGVAANQRLRSLFQARGTERNMNVFLPPLEFCTDNGAMIALAGYHRFPKEAVCHYEMDVFSRVALKTG